MTKIRISAELVKVWSDDALVARDTVKVIDEAIQRVLYDGGNLSAMGTPNLSALGTLLRARGFAGIPLNVFADLMQNEARIALKVGEAP